MGPPGSAQLRRHPLTSRHTNPSSLCSSQIPRYCALAFTLVSIAFFPAWYAVFFALIVRELVFRTEQTRITNRDNRIVYERHARSTHDGGRLTGGVLSVNTIRMQLHGGVGLFGRKVTVPLPG